MDAISDLWDEGRLASQRRAHRYEMLLDATADPEDRDVSQEQVRVQSVRVAAALRCPTRTASREIREAHRVHALLPQSLDLLAAGHLPVPWFERILRAAGDLEEPAALALDEAVATMDLDVSAESFHRALRYRIARLAAATPMPEHAAPENQRRVKMGPPRPDGTGCLQIIGPIPEILSLAQRLDAAAHAVQNAQRTALLEDLPLPMDPGGRIDTTLELPHLAQLRYDLLTRAVLDTDGVDVPAPRFRLNITVPALTLLGAAELPGMCEGTFPIPPDMAREYAARERTWHRILTDPVDGRFLPLEPRTYTPTRAMVEHLRLRGPTCAVPGCGRSSSQLAEADHIIEYDHQHPEQGGPTAVENLHLLCREHHRLKTAGLLDPIRDERTASTWWETDPGHLTRQKDSRDLTTVETVALMQAAWNRHRAEQEVREGRASPPLEPESGDPPPF